ncbi:MAG: hypothetical protein ACOC80_00650 [Petrotogales bacterium]
MILQVTLTEYIGLWAGVVTACILMLILVLVFMWTPAKIYLKSRFSKKPLGYALDRTGRGQFVIGNEGLKGTMKVKKVGPVKLTEGSAIFDKQTKTPFFFFFTEQSDSIPPEYPAIVQEFREHKVPINNYDDYVDYITIANMDEDDAKKAIREKMAGHPEKDIKEATKYILDNKVKLEPKRTYKIHDLVNMFPNNSTPMSIDAYAQHEVSQQTNKAELMKWMLIASVAVLILGIAFAIIWKAVGNGQPPEVIIDGARLTATAAKNASVNMG